MQQASRWIPLAIALSAVTFILFKNFQVSKARRSSGQWLIYCLYKTTRVFWAVVRGIDVGYLEYRRVLREANIEVENEKCLGKLIKAHGTDEAPVYGWQ